MNYVFDVDGTLTPSRGVIDLEFKSFFNTFCLTHNVYLVTGSDKAKTVEQISEHTYNLCKRVYNCNGNDVWEGANNVSTSKWKLTEKMHEWLSIQLTSSDFPKRTGLHFEHRPGMCNFSIVGRNADKNDRMHYVKWDKERDERINIVAMFNALYGKEAEARVGGETGIDIVERGKDKSQVANELKPFVFFGDAIYEGGNDYTIAMEADVFHKVSSWHDTYNLLKELV
jgi:phosphomannomutase